MRKQFNIVNVSSKFAICALPLRADTYKTCSYQCEYCFANNRKIMNPGDDLEIGNIAQMEQMLSRIYIQGDIRPGNFLDRLVADRYDWHLGGMSDPFQPVEKDLQITKQMLDVTNRYDIHILISTKSDTIYGCDIRPELHSFQLSITNVVDRKDIEPGVPGIESRYAFYRSLKDAGFKVGIRIQPFIPGITTTEIIDKFHDADNFTIEGIKLVPQNKEHKEKCLALMGLSQEQFKQMGLLNLRPEYRLELYRPFIEKLDALRIPYSIADNDLRYLGTNVCCCGDRLVHKASGIDTTAMINKYGRDYTKIQMDEELCKAGIGNCKCNGCFASNRQEGCVTVQDFYDKRFDRKTSPFSPKFQYDNKQSNEPEAAVQS